MGLVTKITLKITRLPKVHSIVTACFSSLDQLGDSVYQIIKNEIPLASVELMDKSMVNLILDDGLEKKNSTTLIKDKNLLMLKISGEPDTAEK